MQQSVRKFRSTYFNAIGQQKGPLKLTRRYSAMQKNAVGLVVLLTTPHDQLSVFDCDAQILFRKSGNRQGDPKGVVGNLFNIVRGIAVLGLGSPFDKPLQLVESQKKRMRSQAQFTHGVLTQATLCPPPRKQGRPETYGALTRRPQVSVGATDNRNSWVFWDKTTASECQMHHNPPQTMAPEEVLRVKLEALKREHRDLDEAIRALEDQGRADPLTLRRLKKQKLALKDRITVLEDKITPDIIA